MQTYLTEPIYLYGIKVGHTYQGTIDLIQHYQQILAIATPQQMDDNARQHCKKVIENLNFQKALYEKAEAEKAQQNSPTSTPETI